MKIKKYKQNSIIGLMNSKSFFIMLLLCHCLMINRSFAQISSARSGNWSSSTTWNGGIVPDSTDNVIIQASHTVTLDMTTAKCNNLTITGTNATFRFAITGISTSITVKGNLSIGTGSRFRVETRNPVGAANSYVEHFLTLYGNLTNTGSLDLRAGSTSAGSVNGCAVTFAGSSNSTISLINTNYLSSGEEFGSITINKTGGAKVILSSGNLFMLNSSSVGPVYLTFTEGMIETSSNSIWVALSTGSASIVGASAAKHVSGALGRGMSGSAGTEKKLDIGDADGYRPIYVRSTTGGVASGHYVFARIIKQSANTGTSYLAEGLDSVNSQRYYEVGYSKGGIAGTADSMGFEQFTPTYYADDRVAQDQIGVMVAYSTDNRVNWMSAGPTNHVVDLTNPPTELQSSALSSPFYITNNNKFYIALAYGTTSLSGPFPDSSSRKYGPLTMHTYDLWKASSANPTPLVIWIHGGGLTSGSKSDVSLSLVSTLLARGISVMSVNYRLSPEVIVPNHYLDCARAIQFARYNAAAWNINPDQIGLGGSSAGGLTSFWLSFHDDLKDTANIDPVLRVSSRIKGAACWGGQTTVDKRVAGIWVDPIVLEFSSYFKGTIFGLAADQMDTPAAYALQEMASPYTHVTADDPKIWMYYSYINPPLNSSEAIHHVGFGNHLKMKLDSLGIQNTLLTSTYTGSVTISAVDFWDTVLRESNPLPVELTAFTVTAKGNTAVLNWTTATEVNASQYEVQRSDRNSKTWENRGVVAASGNSNAPINYSFTDHNRGNNSMLYRLKMIDVDGSYTYSNTIELRGISPAEFALEQNYPNPFNPTTTIRFNVAYKTNVVLTIYSPLGEKVAELYNGLADAGTKTVTWNAEGLHSGVYFYELSAGGTKTVKKLTLIK